MQRGAEVVFESLAHHLGLLGEQVTVFGTGPLVEGRAYDYRSTRVVPRERFERVPRIPLLARSDYTYEEITYLPGLIRQFRPSAFDVTVACSFPYTNWALRAMRWRGRPRHVFVTHNGDFPARSDHREFRLFDCDGLVCINPIHFEANRDRWRAALIPNGIDTAEFRPGVRDRQRFGLPEDRRIVLMVSALVPYKRVDEAIRALADCPDDVMLVVAGDGPMRDSIDRLAEDLMPGRFRRMVVPLSEMPALYRAADVFLHMSLEEPFGNGFLEASASAVPIVAHDTVTTRWILGDDAPLVDTTSGATTRTAVMDALDHPPVDLLERSTRCHERFAWERVAIEYRDFLFDVVGSSRGDA